MAIGPGISPQPRSNASFHLMALFRKPLERQSKNTMRTETKKDVENDNPRQ